MSSSAKYTSGTESEHLDVDSDAIHLLEGRGGTSSGLT
jgi:hypothetical protein